MIYLRTRPSFSRNCLSGCFFIVTVLGRTTAPELSSSGAEEWAGCDSGSSSGAFTTIPALVRNSFNQNNSSSYLNSNSLRFVWWKFVGLHYPRPFRTVDQPESTAEDVDVSSHIQILPVPIASVFLDDFVPANQLSLGATRILHQQFRTSLSN